MIGVASDLRYDELYDREESGTNHRMPYTHYPVLFCIRPGVDPARNSLEKESKSCLPAFSNFFEPHRYSLSLSALHVHPKVKIQYKAK